MDVRITARHCRLSAALEQFIRSRIVKLERFMSRLHDAQVVVATDGALATVEMSVGWARGQKFTASADGDTPHAAAARAQARLEKQLRRSKDRIRRRRMGTEAA